MKIPPGELEPVKINLTHRCDSELQYNMKEVVTMKKSEPRIELSKEQKRQAIQHIREYFATERDEEMGDLAAEILLDFMTQKIGPIYYNQAISDVQKYMNEKIEDLYSLMI